MGNCKVIAITNQKGGVGKTTTTVKYLMIDSNGTSHHVYCIESGVSYNYSDTYNGSSGKNSKYFQNLPVTAQYGIMMALMLRGSRDASVMRSARCMAGSSRQGNRSEVKQDESKRYDRAI